MGETDTLGRLFDKLDKINERLARVETLIAERNKREEQLLTRLNALENEVKELRDNQSILSGARGIVAWLVAVGIALWGAIK